MVVGSDGFIGSALSKDFLKKNRPFIETTKTRSKNKIGQLLLDLSNNYLNFVERVMARDYSLIDYGITLVDQEDKTTIDTLDWKSLAKKDGMEMGDIITEFKIENLDRPNKGIVYPFALILLFGFGFMNYKRK